MSLKYFLLFFSIICVRVMLQSGKLHSVNVTLQQTTCGFCDYFTLNHSFHNCPSRVRNDLHLQSLYSARRKKL